jgi:hypothetical protein
LSPRTTALRAPTITGAGTGTFEFEANCSETPFNMILEARL